MAECDTKLPERREAARRSYLPKMRDRDNEAVREWHRGYYAAIEVLDDCIGELFRALKSSGQLDETMIVFTSDHGDNLGSHRQYGKGLPYEESIGIPFLIRYPEKIRAGTRTDALLAPVDIMPTVLSLAGTACPPVDGKDISGAAMGQDADMQDALLIMRMVWLGTNWITNGSEPWRGVRTKQYTYARKSEAKMPWMLFNNLTDPYQMNNLINNPAYADLVTKLNEETDRLLAVANDPEDPEVIARLIFEERERHGQPMGWDVLIPEKIEPGSGFRSLENKGSKS
jgi:arylsulfatase A-like enzyme